MKNANEPMGVEPTADDRALEERYESGKGCLTLLIAVAGFMIVSTAVAIMTGM